MRGLPFALSVLVAGSLLSAGATSAGAAPATRAATVSVAAVALARPSVSTTGVPRGLALRRHVGNLVIKRPGTVIDRMDIRGFVIVRAPRVVIRRSILRGPAGIVRRDSALLSATDRRATGLRVASVTILPTRRSPYIDGVHVSRPSMFDRVNISRTVDGMKLFGHRIRVVNSLLHHFAHFPRDPHWKGKPSHDDAIQVQGGVGISITNNVISGAQNAGLMVTQDHSITRSLSVANNWIDGGSCSVNFKSAGAYKRGMRVDNNTFGAGQRNRGCAIIHNTRYSDLRPQGNRWAASGEPVRVSKGA